MHNKRDDWEPRVVTSTAYTYTWNSIGGVPGIIFANPVVLSHKLNIICIYYLCITLDSWKSGVLIAIEIGYFFQNCVYSVPFRRSKVPIIEAYTDAVCLISK